MLLTGNPRHQFEGSQHSNSTQRPQIKVWAHCGQDSGETRKGKVSQSLTWDIVVNSSPSTYTGFVLSDTFFELGKACVKDDKGA